MKLDALREHTFPTQRMKYFDRDTMLYALSVGAGVDPLDEKELGLVYEKQLSALPTMAAVLAHPGAWIANPRFEVNFLKLLHGEQNLVVDKPLPPEGDLVATYGVRAVVDKGLERGALVFFEKKLADAGSNELFCTVSSTLFLRADGGCGNFGTPPDPLPPAPVDGFEPLGEVRTTLRSALWYRLNGDRNPIHVDPAAGAKAGFEKPILHGLCTYGVAGYVLIRAVCDYDTKRLSSLGVRFTAPVYPGETIRVEGVRVDDGVHFRAVVPERDQVVVLNQGYARIR
jgi:acyl dehydratase